MTAKRRKPLFERLKKGLEEGIAHAQGALTLRTVEVPDEPPEIDAKSLAALRTQAAMSQTVFAKLLNVSTKTLQSWEQGLRQPSDASRRLIQVFREEPNRFGIGIALGLEDASGEGVGGVAFEHRDGALGVVDQLGCLSVG